MILIKNTNNMCDTHSQVLSIKIQLIVDSERISNQFCHIRYFFIRCIFCVRYIVIVYMEKKKERQLLNPKDWKNLRNRIIKEVLFFMSLFLKNYKHVLL